METTNVTLNLEAAKKFMEEYQKQELLYNERLADLNKAYDESMAELAAEFSDFIMVQQQIKPSKPKSTGERHDQLCPLCNKTRHKVEYKMFQQDGVKAVRISMNDLCDTDRSPSFMIKDGDSAKLPLTQGQLNGVYKTHGIKIKQA